MEEEAICEDEVREKASEVPDALGDGGNDWVLESEECSEGLKTHDGGLMIGRLPLAVPLS